MAGIYLGVELVIDTCHLQLDRLKSAIGKFHPSYNYNIPSKYELHLEKLRGKFVLVNVCNTATLLGNNSCVMQQKISNYYL